MHAIGPFDRTAVESRIEALARLFDRLDSEHSEADRSGELGIIRREIGMLRKQLQ